MVISKYINSLACATLLFCAPVSAAHYNDIEPVSVEYYNDLEIESFEDEIMADAEVEVVVVIKEQLPVWYKRPSTYIAAAAVTAVGLYAYSIYKEGKLLSPLAVFGLLCAAKKQANVSNESSTTNTGDKVEDNSEKEIIDTPAVDTVTTVDIDGSPKKYGPLFPIQDTV
jgi:hypothetical protein